MSSNRQAAAQIRTLMRAVDSESTTAVKRGIVVIQTDKRLMRDIRVRLARIGEQHGVPIQLKGASYAWGGVIRSVEVEKSF